MPVFYIIIQKIILLKIIHISFHIKRVPDEADSVPLPFFKLIEMYQE